MSVVIKLWGLIYMIVAFFGSIPVLLLHLIFGVPLGIAFVIMLVAAVPVSLVLLGKLRKAEIDKPDAKLHAEYMEELRKKGYTPRSFELAEQAFEWKRNGTKIDFVYLKDFVIYTADYYNMVEQSEKALACLDLLSKEDVESKSIQFLDKGTTALLYYCVLMEACRGTHNPARAQETFADVQPYLSKTYSIPSLTLSAEIICYHYYMLFEDYDKAGQYVDKMMALNLPADIMSRHIARADYALVKGDRETAREAMKQAKKCIPDGAPVLREIYEFWMKRFSLTETDEE